MNEKGTNNYFFLEGNGFIQYDVFSCFSFVGMNIHSGESRTFPEITNIKNYVFLGVGSQEKMKRGLNTRQQEMVHEFKRNSKGMK